MITNLSLIASSILDSNPFCLMSIAVHVDIDTMW